MVARSFPPSLNLSGGKKKKKERNVFSKGYCCVITGDRDPERHPFMSDSLISCLFHSGRGFTDDSTSPSIRQKSSESWTEFEGACSGFTCLMAYTLLFPSYCADVRGFDSWSQSGCCFVFYKDSFFFMIKTKATCHCTGGPHWLTHYDLKCWFSHLKYCPSLFFFDHL